MIGLRIQGRIQDFGLGGVNLSQFPFLFPFPPLPSFFLLPLSLLSLSSPSFSPISPYPFLSLSFPSLSLLTLSLLLLKIISSVLSFLVDLHYAAAHVKGRFHYARIRAYTHQGCSLGLERLGLETIFRTSRPRLGLGT